MHEVKFYAVMNYAMMGGAKLLNTVKHCCDYSYYSYITFTFYTCYTYTLQWIKTEKLMIRIGMLFAYLNHNTANCK